MRLGMLFMALIVNATYTANLAFFLTAAAPKVGGPRTMKEMERMTACVADAAWEPFFTRYVHSVVSPGGETTFGASFGGMAWCHQQLLEGQVDIILGERFYLQTYLVGEHTRDSQCATLTFAPEEIVMNYESFSALFNTATTGPLVHRLFDLSLVRFLYENLPQFRSLCETFLRDGIECPVPGSNSGQIDFKGMEGLFLISGSMAFIAVVCFLAAPWLEPLRRGADDATSATKDGDDPTKDQEVLDQEMLLQESKLLEVVLSRIGQLEERLGQQSGPDAAKELVGSVQGSRGTCSRPWTQGLGQPLDPGPKVWASL